MRLSFRLDAEGSYTEPRHYHPGAAKSQTPLLYYADLRNQGLRRILLATSRGRRVSHEENNLPDTSESKFKHRQNHDGSLDSICLCCFQTVASAADEFSLTTMEFAHDCREGEVRGHGWRRPRDYHWSEFWQ
jgi:hypothetical protein